MDSYDLVQQKKAMRKEMLAKRSSLDANFKQKYDAAICEGLTAWVEKNKARVVHAYLPIGSEIDIEPAIIHWLKTGVTVVCPKTLPARKLLNLQLFSLHELESGHFNTRHPNHTVPFEGTYDLVICPGLAFDAQNHRLGYGSGYYDAFLSGTSAHRMGICYPFQMVGEVPVASHDTTLDGILYFPGI